MQLKIAILRGQKSFKRKPRRRVVKNDFERKSDYTNYFLLAVKYIKWTAKKNS